MAARKSKPKATDAAQLNPLTGRPANTFSAATNRTLPPPTAVRPFTPITKPDPAGTDTASGAARRVPDVEAQTRERRRLRAAHREATQPGAPIDAQVGYRKPDDMSHEDFALVTGVRHMFPTDHTGPAINEPHEAHSAVTVQRRAEDFTGPEYRKGEAILSHYGHDARNPLASLVETQHRRLNRVVAEHLQAGVEESASQLFYGGEVKTEIPEHPAMDEAHYQGVTESQRKFRQHTASIADHPELTRLTPGATRQGRVQAASVMLSQATADTSPNSKWRENGRWPNLDQAHESVMAALDQRPPKYLTGRTPNEVKAADRADEMSSSGDYDAHKYGNPRTAPKTIAFRGALAAHDAPDIFRPTDVHEASAAFPGLGTAKSVVHVDPTTGTGVRIHADMPASASVGRPVQMKVGPGGGLKPVKGLSRPEEALNVGKSIVHTLNDRAGREVAARVGISRGVNYADNVAQHQAATWGSIQVARRDVNVSHADQYPVVRDWGAEGHDDLNPTGRQLFGARAGLGRQFALNPNTKRDVVPIHDKPYAI